MPTGSDSGQEASSPTGVPLPAVQQGLQLRFVLRSPSLFQNQATGKLRPALQREGEGEEQALCGNVRLLCTADLQVSSRSTNDFKSLLRAQPEANPRLPRYRKAGLFPVAYPKQWLKFQEGQVRVGKQVKAWFGLDAFWVQFPTNLRWESIKELRILPRHGVFYLEWVYAKPPQPHPLDPTKALAMSPVWLSTPA